ncbi:MAG: peptidylprolyl isomerase [Chitinophagales bacterium]|nr:peptidylprolyl isomerase [Chitinophagales bacterium]
MKMIVLLTGLITLLIFSESFAQAPSTTNPVLFTIGSEQVTKDEFVKVYQKTNVSGEADFSEKSLRDYLDLYVNFRLKVKQSRDMKMDTTAAVLNEFKTYRSKLTPAYMFDTTILRQAYNRMQKDVHIEHVLLKLDPNASQADTLKAYKRITNWKNQITSGKKDFNTLAADSSSDPSAKDNKGDLGYITALQVIYPFETAAYSTPVGKMTIVRTRFGYHLIKVLDVRHSRGMITASHLFIKVAQNATSEDKTKAKQKIDSLYQALKNGASWDDLVKQNSQDKTSAANGGKLPSFGTGQMVGEFEDVAFALKNPGDMSEPVQTKFGWHIIKLIEKKPIGTYEQTRDDIKKKVENGPWSEYAKQSFLNQVKKEYRFTEFPEKKKVLMSKMDSSLLKGNWNDSAMMNMNDVLFTFTDTKWVPEKKSYTQKDFADFILKNQRKFLNQGGLQSMYNKLYDAFVLASAGNFEDARLESKYPPFRDLMEEYMNGILLFDLASDKVWTKAVEDTTGLKTFYEAGKNNYMGQERAQVTTYMCKNKDCEEDLKKYMAKNSSDNDLLSKLNRKGKTNLTIATAEFEKGKESEIEKLGWGTAGTTYTVNSDSVFKIMKIVSILPPAPKQLTDVKGYVVADYQENLEKKWIADLRQKYPVKINEQVFQSIVKK